VKISSNLLQKAQERDMRSIYLARISAISLAASSQAWAQSAPAQQSVDDGDEIIVIATKREQTLQDMPMSLVVTYDETVERTQFVTLSISNLLFHRLRLHNSIQQPNPTSLFAASVTGTGVSGLKVR
jgi:voltage-gated potassium channel Kch